MSTPRCPHCGSSNTVSGNCTSKCLDCNWIVGADGVCSFPPKPAPEPDECAKCRRTLSAAELALGGTCWKCERKRDAPHSRSEMRRLDAQGLMTKPAEPDIGPLETALKYAKLDREIFPSKPAEFRSPTESELESPMFNAIWSAVKGYDAKRPGAGGYASMNGSDVCRILDAIAASKPAADERPAREWTLEWDSNFDNMPPVVTSGPDVNPGEVIHVREVKK